MAKTFNKGTRVQWQWGNGCAKGQIKQVYKEKTTKTIKGSEITRNGSDDNPAYLIEQQDGNQALKLHSEISESG